MLYFCFRVERSRVKVVAVTTSLQITRQEYTLNTAPRPHRRYHHPSCLTMRALLPWEPSARNSWTVLDATKSPSHRNQNPILNTSSCSINYLKLTLHGKDSLSFKVPQRKQKSLFKMGGDGVRKGMGQKRYALKELRLMEEWRTVFLLEKNQ